METFAHLLASPVGNLLIKVNDTGALVRLEFAPSRSIEEMQQERIGHADELTWDARACEAVSRQLEEYFKMQRRQFDLSIEPQGTHFQLRVWEELLRIPYGETISYLELSRRLGNPKAVRAVGGANAANPIAIVIPCHRVIGSDRRLIGYGGGLNIKQALLALEGVLLF